MTFRHPPHRRKSLGERFDDFCFFYAIPFCLVLGLVVIGWQIWKAFV